jgi:hypothetical protein
MAQSSNVIPREAPRPAEFRSEGKPPAVGDLVLKVARMKEDGREF